MSGSAGKLLALTKALAVQWEQTRQTWRDTKCEQFDREYMQELFASVDRAASVMEQVDKLIAKIRSDCE